MKSFIITLSALIFICSGITRPVFACPDQEADSKKMIENFLTNPQLQDARQETGTTNLNISQITTVADQNVCQTLNNEFSSFKDDYEINFYKIGNFYFVTQIIKQPEDSNKISTGLSYIYIYDENLNFIKAYSG